MLFYGKPLVGWQENKEEDWIINVIKDGLRPSGKLFFTVYKRGYELERARMYKAAGDIIELNTSPSPEERDIVLVPDAFKGEKHKSRAYRREDIEDLLSRISQKIKIHGDIREVGKYMYGVLINT